MSQSSCRPPRLFAFQKTAEAIRDGITSRAGKLEDALEAYVQQCEENYRRDTTGTEDVIRGWTQNYRALGAWTFKVGQAFQEAGARDIHMLKGAQGPVKTFDDSKLDLPLPAGAGTQEFDHTGLPPRPDDPALKKFLLNLGVPVDVAGSAADGTKLGKWLAGVGTVLTVFDAIDQQRAADANTYLSDSDRAWRIVVQSAAQLGGSTAGGALGGAAAGLCGPAVAACAVATAPAGSYLGSLLGGAVADSVLKQYGPGEHDYDELQKDLANPFGDPAMSRSDVALAESLRVQANARAVALAGTRPGLGDVKRYLHAQPTNNVPAPLSWYPNAIPPQPR